MEIWKDINGYEGCYKVSNLGNVLSCERKVRHPTGFKKRNPERMLKPQFSKYPMVAICKNGTIKRTPVHRLVAEAFIENPNHYPVVNHKNGIRTDNRVENLEWCTQKQNIRHAISDLSVNYHTIAKRNRPITRNDGVVFCSINEAAKASGTTRGNIYFQMAGKRKTAGGFTFAPEAQVDREWNSGGKG